MSEDNRSPRDVEEQAASSVDDTETSVPETDGQPPEEGPVRRPLIRATLTLPEGTPPTPREPPVFTMHQQQARSGSGQARGGNWNGRANRDSGHPNKKKSAQGRRSSGGGGNKASSRQDQGGSKRSSSGRRSSGRRDKGRPR